MFLHFSCEDSGPPIQYSLFFDFFMTMRTPEELSNLIKGLIEEYTPEVKGFFAYIFESVIKVLIN